MSKKVNCIVASTAQYKVYESDSYTWSLTHICTHADREAGFLGAATARRAGDPTPRAASWSSAEAAVSTASTMAGRIHHGAARGESTVWLLRGASLETARARRRTRDPAILDCLTRLTCGFDGYVRKKQAHVPVKTACQMREAVENGRVPGRKRRAGTEEGRK